MSRPEKIRFLVLRTLGNFFILLTLFGFFATFGPAVYFEVIFRISNFRGVEYVVAAESNDANFGSILDQRRNAQQRQVSDSSQGLLNSGISGQKSQILSPKDTQFSILIPKIGASERVFENVDPSNEKEYGKTLLEGVAHAQGSAFPGYGGNTYIFAHSADSFWNVGRYNAVFYLLKELQPGDDVIVFFQNKRFNYEVTETKIVDATNLDYLKSDIGTGETLTLQTCWPPGTTWKRMLVFAKPKVQ
ncbi:MAG TPA: sortase [Candidatus Levybacteria bacterium]|nr:sortase [Candidatus Levybacteria bacterium]